MSESMSQLSPIALDLIKEERDRVAQQYNYINPPSPAENQQLEQDIINSRMGLGATIGHSLAGYGSKTLSHISGSLSTVPDLMQGGSDGMYIPEMGEYVSTEPIKEFAREQVKPVLEESRKYYDEVYNEHFVKTGLSKLSWDKDFFTPQYIASRGTQTTLSFMEFWLGGRALKLGGELLGAGGVQAALAKAEQAAVKKAFLGGAEAAAKGAVEVPASFQTLAGSYQVIPGTGFSSVAAEAAKGSSFFTPDVLASMGREMAVAVPMALESAASIEAKRSFGALTKAVVSLTQPMGRAELIGAGTMLEAPPMVDNINENLKIAYPNMDPQERAARALTGGLIGGTIAGWAESIVPGLMLGKNNPLSTKLVTRIMGTSMLLPYVIIDFGLEVGAEMMTEASQELTSILAENMASRENPVEGFQSINWPVAFNAMIESAASAFWGAGMLQAPHAGISGAQYKEMQTEKLYKFATQEAVNGSPQALNALVMQEKSRMRSKYDQFAGVREHIENHPNWDVDSILTASVNGAIDLSNTERMALDFAQVPTKDGKHVPIREYMRENPSEILLDVISRPDLFKIKVNGAVLEQQDPKFPIFVKVNGSEYRVFGDMTDELKGKELYQVLGANAEKIFETSNMDAYGLEYLESRNTDTNRLMSEISQIYKKSEIKESDLVYYNEKNGNSGFAKHLLFEEDIPQGEDRTKYTARMRDRVEYLNHLAVRYFTINNQYVEGPDRAFEWENREQSAENYANMVERLHK